MYPKMIKTTIEGLSIEETKVLRKRGIAVPALTKLGNFFVFMNSSYYLSDYSNPCNGKCS